MKKHQTGRELLEKMRAVAHGDRDAAKRCAYTDCRAPLSGPFGTPGVSLSRADNETLICSGCGRREALNRNLLGTRFRGFERRRRA